jgi:hypothetical protein
MLWFVGKVLIFSEYSKNVVVAFLFSTSFQLLTFPTINHLITIAKSAL